jgi:diadenosine tetraphosphate (Ap4A) HIT family hydrolase
MPTINECCLCSQIAGAPENDLIARLLPEEPYARRVLFESDAFAAIPSLGPLAVGHSLLCPKEHVRSFAELDPTLHGELAETKRVLIERLMEMTGDAIHVFEHGMASAGNRIVCTVDHAHMHFVPLPLLDRPADLGSGDWIEFDGSLDALREISAEREYVLYEAPAGAAFVRVANGAGIESQYMRRRIAAWLGKEARWNWRATPEARLVDATWRRFSSLQPSR